ncbi:PREDICTED: chitin-binding lectin 1-like [Populus euphratica]|uniref:Chitin-binding lectin 1-like n=1 Tax=Populus euphratica TaxID=75702 RepID=A0AAJ6VBX8_POPEU|nr:PREDICTED: chitin-binding lectin 1-like [Populus euphratica]
MGTFKIHLLLFFLMAVTVSSTLQGDVCALINCGHGTCKASNASLLGFECECNSGWKKIEIGPLTFPSCVIPNCTFDLGCGNGASPSPAASQPPPLNLSNPCNLVWCGDGTCVANGTGHICQCNEGSSNLLNETDLACIKQCSFGADCIGLLPGMLLSPPSGQLPPPPPPPPPPPTPVPPTPPPSSSASPKTNDRASRLDRIIEFLEESLCIINDIVSSNFANMAIEKITDAQHDQDIVYGKND